MVVFSVSVTPVVLSVLVRVAVLVTVPAVAVAAAFTVSVISARLTVALPPANNVPRLASSRLAEELKVTVPVRGVVSLTVKVPLTKLMPAEAYR